jgi:hypothetical protein
MSEEVYRSTIAQGLFYVDGKPLSLADYPMFQAVFDGNYSRLLLKTGRQVTKSTTLAAFMIAEAIASAPFRSYYISPTQEQTRKFSHTRVAKILAYSPDVRKAFVGPESIDNVLLRMLKNGSEMAFTYAMDDPDRARGYSADRCCFDASAQVLTRAGWRCVKDLTLADEVADVDDEGCIRWHRPSKLFALPYTGQMVKFHHAGMDLRVTGDHKMWVNFRVKTGPRYKTPDVWQFASALDIARTERMGFKMTSACRIDDAPPVVIHVPGSSIGYATSRSPVDVDARAFSEFMGWYLAEGHVSWRRTKGVRRNGSAIITQNASRYSLDIEDCLRRCGFTYSRQPSSRQTKKGRVVKHTYVIASSQVCQYVAPLGNSFSKYIPAVFFEHPALLPSLLRALYQGDASIVIDRWDHGTLRTRSRRLADDVHRAWALLGRPAVVHTRQMPQRPGGPPLPLYEVQAYAESHAVFWRSEYATKRRVSVEEVVNEPVYCFTVPHHRPIVRGGVDQRPIIAGQCFDEIQDMLYEAVIPVIEECMARSNYQYSAYAGTPKTMENTIEVLWSLSTQTEWCMRCDGCSKWTFVDGVKALGKKGLICVSCGHLLNPRAGKWVDMVPGASIKGFHVSQAIMPTDVPAAWVPGSEGFDRAVERWDKLLYKMNSPLYGESKFLNECIGVSTSTGVRLLTKEVLESLCDEKLVIERLPQPGAKKGIVRTTAGVDWSGGGGEVKGSEGLYKSRTVLHIWGQQADGRLRTLTSKIFPNGHAVGWIDEIVELCNKWGVEMVGADAGEGMLANSFLRQRLGDHRVLAFRYLNLSKPMETWNPSTLAYHVDRTTMIDNYARQLLHKQVIFPRLSDAQPAINDILNVYEEVTHAGRRVWRHSPTMPDDSLHAQVFGWLANGVLSGNLRFT